MWAENIAHKVRVLLDESGPLSMVFTDSPINEHVGQSLLSCSNDLT